MAKYSKDTVVTHNIEITDDEYTTMQRGHVVKIRIGNDGFLIINHSVNGD